MWRLVHVLPLLALVACASTGQWVWRRADGAEDPVQLRDDIDACETHARIAHNRGPFPSASNARPYGGWGNFTFESCMHHRNWALEYVRPAGSGATAAHSEETPTGAAKKPSDR